MKVRKLDTVAEQVVSAYTNGTCLEELSKLFNVSVNTVRNLLVARAVPLRKRGRPTKVKETK